MSKLQPIIQSTYDAQGLKGVRALQTELNAIVKTLAADEKRKTAARRNMRVVLKSLPRAVAPKGSGCSASGLRYEQLVANCLKNTTWKNRAVSCSDPAGSSAGNDLTLSIGSAHALEIGLELKRPSPDWMQVCLSHDVETGSWTVDPAGRSKIPIQCRELYRQAIQNQILWSGRVPSFLHSNVMYDAWCEEKKGQFEDTYLDCADDLIARLYEAKGCQYLQIAGKGLYSLHAGHGDPLELDVPVFRCPQRIRIRTKVHGRTSQNGYASLSVTAAAQPVALAQLAPSPYSLDDPDRFPAALKKHSE